MQKKLKNKIWINDHSWFVTVVFRKHLGCTTRLMGEIFGQNSIRSLPLSRMLCSEPFAWAACQSRLRGGSKCQRWWYRVRRFGVILTCLSHLWPSLLNMIKVWPNITINKMPNTRCLILVSISGLSIVTNSHRSVCVLSFRSSLESSVFLQNRWEPGVGTSMTWAPKFPEMNFIPWST